MLIVPDADLSAARPYVDWLERNGEQVEIVAVAEWCAAQLESADALMLIGGGDVEPWRYGGEAHSETAAGDPPRDAAEIQALRDAQTMGKPALGICRGMQVAAVARGGSLIQHVPDQISESDERHRRMSPTEDAYHAVQVCGESPLAAALAGVHQVNSAHHQAVDPRAMGEGIRAAACSPCGIPEASEGISDPALWLVQWHPERLPPGHPAGDGLLRAWALHNQRL
ncbi:MAG: gamma-glutamyl-gamma-aminobutyrate hydrolase family protein [Kiritimatiellae bacterium]|nr:gamma-glutamyl-gamma-aminobutyrate hydrolase family protein [Kiritimatiellia bacterium]